MAPVAGWERSSRLQRLLWMNEYVSLSHEIILVESSFVLKDQNDRCIKMVRAGLTDDKLLFAEYEHCLIISDYDKTSTAFSFLHELNADLEGLRLTSLLPLQHVSLTVCKDVRKRGRYVFRLRLCGGMIWYMELADPHYRKTKWREWVMQLRRAKDRMKSKDSLTRGSINKLSFKESFIERGGRVQIQSIRKLDVNKNGLKEQLLRHRHSSKILEIGHNEMCADDSFESLPRQSTEGLTNHSSASERSVMMSNNQRSRMICNKRKTKSQNQSKSYGSLHPLDQHSNHNTLSDNFVQRFKARIYDTGDSDIYESNSTIFTNQNEPTDVSKTTLTYNIPSKKSHAIMENISLTKKLNLLKTRTGALDASRHSAQVSAFGDPPDGIEITDTNFNEAKLLDELDLKSLQNLCFCVGDYFGKFNYEGHEHGHVGRIRPMASLTALPVLLDSEASNMQKKSSLDTDKEEMHHHLSLPDVLDGEASFLEDLHSTDTAAHQTSLAYLDLENENSSLKPRVVNGHVMLLSPSEYELYHSVEEHRNRPMDLRFATMKHPEVFRREQKFANMFKDENHSIVTRARDRPNYKAQLVMSEDNLIIRGTEFQPKSGGIKVEKKKTRWFRCLQFFKRKRKTPIDKSPSIVVIEYVNQIDIDVLAQEMTIIDTELFLRIHEAELIGCTWLKIDRHSKAPNIMASIEFFQRIFGIVTTEILLPKGVEERAELLAKFVRIAKKCIELKNYHSTQAIICGLKSPAVYRLEESWRTFARDYPQSFGFWLEINQIFMEDKLDEYFKRIEEALLQPPCLPFLGHFLKAVVQFYSTEDELEVVISETSFSGPSSVTSQSIAQQENSDASFHSALSQAILTDQETTPTVIKTSIIHSRIGSFLAPLQSFRDLVKPKGTPSDQIKSTTQEVHLQVVSKMATVRKRCIQRLIIQYAKHLAMERGIVWIANKQENKHTWDVVLDKAFDFSDMFKFVSNSQAADSNDLTRHNFSNLRLAVERRNHRKLCNKSISAEQELTEGLFCIQISAIQYEIAPNETVREFLLKAHYNSDIDNFSLSLRREPPTG